MADEAPKTEGPPEGQDTTHFNAAKIKIIKALNTLDCAEKRASVMAQVCMALGYYSAGISFAEAALRNRNFGP